MAKVSLTKYIADLKAYLEEQEAAVLLDPRNSEILMRLKRLKAEMNYYKNVAIAELAREAAKGTTKENVEVTKYIKKTIERLERQISKEEKWHVEGTLESRAHKWLNKKKTAKKKAELEKLKEFENNSDGFVDYLLTKQGASKSETIRIIAESNSFTTKTGRDKDGNEQNLFLSKDANGSFIVNQPNVELAKAYVSGDKAPFEALVSIKFIEKEMIDAENKTIKDIKSVDEFVSQIIKRNALVSERETAIASLESINEELNKHPIKRIFGMHAERKKRKEYIEKMQKSEYDIEFVIDLGIFQIYKDLKEANAVGGLIPNDLDDMYVNAADGPCWEQVTFGDPNKTPDKVIEEITANLQANHVANCKQAEKDKAALLKKVPVAMKSADINALQLILEKGEESIDTKETLESLLRVSTNNGPLAILDYASVILKPKELVEANFMGNKETVGAYAAEKSSRKR